MGDAIDYDIVSEREIEELIRRVKNLLGQGWTLAGGIAVAEIHHTLVFSQALSKQSSSPDRT